MRQWKRGWDSSSAPRGGGAAPPRHCPPITVVHLRTRQALTRPFFT